MPLTDFNIPSKWIQLGLSATIISALSLLLSFELNPLPARLEESHSPILLYDDGSVAHIQLSPDDRWRTEADLDRIDQAYIHALLTIEDERFYWHAGFDPLSITRALIQNIVSGEIISGASTLTMQLVRIVEPRPRTYRSKIIETWRAMQLEWHFSKSEILEHYLTFIPFGKNIEGIEAASLAYFGRLPQHLEAHQIALLIAIPQNPNARYPHPNNMDRLRRSRDHIANLLLSKDALPIEDEDEIQTSVLNKAVPQRALAFPRDVPHLMDQLKPHLSPSTRIRTTLNSDIQAGIHQTLEERYLDYQRRGIHNAAIIIAHKHTGDIKGLIGNFDYWSGEHASTIPAYSTMRSAGSTLKPFLYALSIDLGLATPSRIMEDIPHDFRGYQPRNYGASYHGLVTLRESLSQSYNIPFIEVLSEMGLNEFLHHLSGLGIRKYERRKDQLGLSAAVGLEVTPLELTQAYLVLADMGEMKPLHLLESNILEQKVLPSFAAQNNSSISAGASWLTGEALRQRDRPDFPERMQYTSRQKPFSWKTGTSFGFHDAWTAGWGEDYVAVIWFGNLNHDSSVHLIGSEAAGTVFFEVMERLEEAFVPPSKPDSLTVVKVCAQTGHIPTSACSETVSTLAPKTRVPTQTCDEHHHIFVDAQGYRSTPMCTSEPLTTQTVWVPSTEFQRWSKLPVSLPPMAQNCRQSATINSIMKIDSPKPNHRILLLNDGQEQSIPLEATHNDPHAQLYWYVDQEFIGMSDEANQLWWTPTEGAHTISVEDSRGNSDQIDVQVDSFSNVATDGL